MLTHAKGAIVNHSSMVGLVGGRLSPAYVASKHGVVGLTKLAALQYAQQGIRINALCAGVIRTPMVESLFNDTPEMEEGLTGLHPIWRLGTPEEVAEAVIWLCSDAASFVTRHAMSVDGGYVAQ